MKKKLYVNLHIRANVIVSNIISFFIHIPSPRRGRVTSFLGLGLGTKTTATTQQRAG